MNARRIIVRLFGLGLAGCIASACAATPQAPQTSEPVEEVSEEQASLLPQTPPGAKLEWLLQKLNAEAVMLSEQEADNYFAASFLAVLPHAQLQTVLAQVAAAYAPFQGLKIVTQDPQIVVLRVRAKDGSEFVLQVAVEAEKPHRIAGFNIAPATTAAEELPASWEAIRERLAAQGEGRQLLAARIDGGGECHPIEAVNAAAPLAIGSTFKVYVLVAVAQAVHEGRMSWEDELPIDDAHKSLPSGVMHNEVSGTPFMLGTYADKMISISDNTATDHLIAHVGRQSVEATVESSGHHDPQRMRPFTVTHEFMKLKIGMDAAARDAYVALDEAGRRAFLDETLAQTPLPELEEAMTWTAPRHIDTLEWFASPEDLCRLYAHFADNAVEPAYERALEAMSHRDGGLRIGEHPFAYVGFKGGSEPGVLHLSWLLRNEDGHWYVVVVAGNDTEQAVDLNSLLDLGRASIKLLGQAPDEPGGE